MGRWNRRQETEVMKKVYHEIDSANGEPVTFTKLAGMFTQKRFSEVVALLREDIANRHLEYGENDAQFGCTVRRKKVEP
jgi:hypothetical protein